MWLVRSPEAEAGGRVGKRFGNCAEFKTSHGQQLPLPPLPFVPSVPLFICFKQTTAKCRKSFACAASLPVSLCVCACRACVCSCLDGFVDLWPDCKCIKCQRKHCNLLPNPAQTPPKWSAEPTTLPRLAALTSATPTLSLCVCVCCWCFGICVNFTHTRTHTLTQTYCGLCRL